jgi:hypothetical protein
MGGSKDAGVAHDTVRAFSAPPRPTVTTLTARGNRRRASAKVDGSTGRLLGL